MEKINLFMESTKKDPEETISEIQKLFRKFNVPVRDILVNYDDDNEVEAVSFMLLINDQKIPYKLPADHRPILIMANERLLKYIRPGDEQQSRRVAWRQIFRWVESQLALVQTGQGTVDQIFLPYMMIDNNNTVYDKFIEIGHQKFLNA